MFDCDFLMFLIEKMPTILLAGLIIWCVAIAVVSVIALIGVVIFRLMER